jgi:hypothetical protein
VVLLQVVHRRANRGPIESFGQGAAQIVQDVQQHNLAGVEEVSR